MKIKRIGFVGWRGFVFPVNGKIIPCIIATKGMPCSKDKVAINEQR